MNLTIRRFLSVFTLVSRIPVRKAFEPDFSRADFWLPAIGPAASAAAIAGLAVGGLVFRDSWLATIAAVAAQYALFNLFHLDGLLDTADAMLGFAVPERRLEILKDSRIGAYAFFAGTVVFTARIAAISLMAPGGVAGSAVVAALLAAPAAGRAAAAIVPLASKPVKEEGLGALMRDFSAWRVVAGLAAGLVPLAVWAGVSGNPGAGIAAAGAACIAAPVAGFSMAGLYRNRVGGFTGDALGAAVETGELLVLLLLVAALPRLGIFP